MGSTKDHYQLASLDSIDQEIVRALRLDARISNAALADRVGVAQSTCHQRVRALVQRGVISRFTAELSADQLGLTLQVLISVNIRSGQRAAVTRFAQEMRSLPQVVQTFFLGGSEDFIIHIAARNSDDVRDFVVMHLSTHPAVASTRTSIVFDHVVAR
ncbi:Lrp/AsnC family transcriptional regulator [Jonesia quinghaiensis]|uniref:Lrp/AsnC family transcriptional regulator n=1 Tax=Jonesia quinghaiensis TaxID=262806 RepID=UPI000406AE2F|nr:Lrp/AsnC family transcriptional regulator [Jonesia quinghaiensis]